MRTLPCSSPKPAPMTAACTASSASTPAPISSAPLPRAMTRAPICPLSIGTSPSSTRPSPSTSPSTSRSTTSTSAPASAASSPSPAAPCRRPVIRSLSRWSPTWERNPPTWMPLATSISIPPPRANMNCRPCPSTAASTPPATCPLASIATSPASPSRWRATRQSNLPWKIPRVCPSTGASFRCSCAARISPGPAKPNPCAPVSAERVSCPAAMTCRSSPVPPGM